MLNQQKGVDYMSIAWNFIKQIVYYAKHVFCVYFVLI